jgi:hypothetical protein
MAHVAAVLAMAPTALFVGDGGDGGADPFSAEQAMRYSTFLTSATRSPAAWPSRAPAATATLTTTPDLTAVT